MKDDDGNFFSNLPFYTILSDKKEGRKQLPPPPNIQLSFTVQLGSLATAGVPALNLYTLLSGGGVGVKHQVRKQRIKKCINTSNPKIATHQTEEEPKTSSHTHTAQECRQQKCQLFYCRATRILPLAMVFPLLQRSTPLCWVAL